MNFLGYLAILIIYFKATGVWPDTSYWWAALCAILSDQSTTIINYRSKKNG